MPKGFCVRLLPHKSSDNNFNEPFLPCEDTILMDFSLEMINTQRGFYKIKIYIFMNRNVEKAAIRHGLSHLSYYPNHNLGAL